MSFLNSKWTWIVLIGVGVVWLVYRKNTTPINSDRSSQPAQSSLPANPVSSSSNFSSFLNGVPDPAFLNRLVSGTPSVRKAALEELKSWAISEQLHYVPVLLEKVPEYEEVNTKILIPMAERAVPELVEGLKHVDLAVRTRCIYILAQIGKPAFPAASALRERIANDPDPYIRSQSVLALGSIQADDEPTIQFLARLLGQPNEGVRSNALRVLEVFGPKAASAVPYLKQALANGPAAQKDRILQVLNRIGTPEAMAIYNDELKIQPTEERDIRPFEKTPPENLPPESQEESQ